MLKRELIIVWNIMVISYVWALIIRLSFCTRIGQIHARVYRQVQRGRKRKGL